MNALSRGASLAFSLGALLSIVPQSRAQPTLFDDQFELPAGFHIYRAAEPGLTGGSYDITFDGDGRLLVGDGEAVRRLGDSDGDGVYDEQQIIATGLGGRGPQGLLVLGDNLYAVGGDGVQLYSGYQSGGILQHEGRLGAPFNTGGDHAAHTLLRGIDGYIYLVSGDGGGIGGRKHITEDSSPCLQERVASVFRFSPDGSKWECIASGGRNPPSLGMNYLGEFFSFDSDMEWHVDLPFYRPVRLNHWATGADLGWQGVGAYPPYYIDTIPGILDVGRGSPDWGVFYEHKQFPKRYRDAFICCDYRWKSATSGGYNSSGRLVAFHMERDGATWKAEMTELAKAKPGAKDAAGRAINFGLVDVDVAPDGSICISDHNQGVWRIFYDDSPQPTVPPIIPEKPNSSQQPASEWSRLRSKRPVEQLIRFVRDPALTTRLRLHYIRLLAPEFATLDPELVAELAGNPSPEVRGQAAWLMGIRLQPDEVPKLIELLADKDPFVRRRAAEALGRHADKRAAHALLGLCGDSDRHVSYAAMTALSHLPSAEFLAGAIRFDSENVKMRSLVAAHLRGEPFDAETVNSVVRWILEREAGAVGQLDRLRVLGLFQKQIETDPAVAQLAHDFVLTGLASDHRDLRWEYARIAGQYDIAAAFAPLLQMLENEKDGVTQFHIAMALAGISDGWTEQEGIRLAKWLASTQTGWFAEHAGKGRQFPGFWATTLNQLAARHGASLAGLLDEIVPGSQLANIALKGLGTRPGDDKLLIKHYRDAKDDRAREQLLDLMATVSSPALAEFLIDELARAMAADDRASIDQLLMALLAQPLNAKQAGQMVMDTLLNSDNPDLLTRAAARVASDRRTISQYEGVDPKAIGYRLLTLLTRHPDHAGAMEHALATLMERERPAGKREARVIWSSAEQIDGDQVWFAKDFELPADVSGGELLITCDNVFTAYINGTKVAASDRWEKPLRLAVGEHLRAGKNLLAVHGVNQGGPAGLIAALNWQTKAGTAGRLTTDTSWPMSKRASESWQTDGTRDGAQWVPSIDVSEPTENALDAFRQLEPFDAEAEWVAAQEFWQKWYRDRFGEAFVAPTVADAERMTDEALHALIAGAEKLDAGDAARGRQLYLNTGCFACHGGIGETATTLFGPALAGATLRLNRNELADAIVYPSKQVVERFKASVLQTTGGKTLNGFITENSDAFVSITDLQNNVTRLPKAKVKSIESQDTSLMPAKLLNALSQDEVRDLLAFLASMQ